MLAKSKLNSIEPIICFRKRLDSNRYLELKYRIRKTIRTRLSDFEKG